MTSLSKVLTKNRKAPQTLIREELERFLGRSIPLSNWKKLSRGAFHHLVDKPDCRVFGRIAYTSKTLAVFEGHLIYPQEGVAYLSIEIHLPFLNGDTVVWTNFAPTKSVTSL